MKILLINRPKLKYSFCLYILLFVFGFSACTKQVITDKKAQPNSAAHLETSSAQETAAADKPSNNDAADKRPAAAYAHAEAEIASDTEQEKMEKILAMLHEADAFWDKGDVDKTISTLDRAYALLLEENSDAEMPRQKDDLRLLISKRILAVYSAQQSLTRGKTSEIPLKMNEDIEREIRSFQGPEREFFISSYQRAGIYREIILKELKMAGIPEEFIWLPLVESGYKINALSRARALGLWQFIPSTGYKFGLSRDEWIDERMDAIKSTQAAIAYLKELHAMFGDWLTVLAAYNCGEGRVLRVISRQRINYFDRFWDLYRLLPQETARYVPRFLATLHIIKDPQKYGFELPPQDTAAFSFQVVKVDRMMKLQDIAALLDVSEEIMCILNAELRHKITPDREYNLKIPVNALDKFVQVAADIPAAEKPRLAEKTSVVRHKVKRGETLSSIAQRYGVSLVSLREHNNLRANSVLVAGRILTIPMPGVQKAAGAISVQNHKESAMTNDGRYRVQRGDTLQSIARRFEVSVERIREINNLQTDAIYAGQWIQLKNVPQKTAQAKLKNKVLTTEDIESLGTDKYIVTKGDNLYRIAQKNNIDVARLKELNNLSDEKITPGQILIIK